MEVVALPSTLSPTLTAHKWELYISMATITTMAGYMPLLADISGLAAIFYKKKVEEMNSECLFQ